MELLTNLFIVVILFLSFRLIWTIGCYFKYGNIASNYVEYLYRSLFGPGSNIDWNNRMKLCEEFYKANPHKCVSDKLGFSGHIFLKFFFNFKKWHYRNMLPNIDFWDEILFVTNLVEKNKQQEYEEMMKNKPTKEEIKKEKMKKFDIVKNDLYERLTRNEC